MTSADLASLIWPLSFVLVMLFIIRRIGDDVQPVVKGIAGGLAKHSQQYALMYAMGALYACAASLQALGEVAQSFGWLYVAAFAKVVQPGAVAVIAYVTKPPAVSQVQDQPKTS